MQVQCLIIGGGIAGMFALHQLRARGIQTLLVERDSLGSGQTICSQGILHAGMKYSLSGSVTSAAGRVDEQVGVWQSMLTEGGNCDLRGVAVLSRQCWLWRASGLGSALGLKGAQFSLKIRPTAVADDQLPEALKGSPGEVLSLGETVIDPCSLLRELHCQHRAFATRACIQKMSSDGKSISCDFGPDGQVEARCVVLAAGEGTGRLLAMAGIQSPQMQLRPLRQGLLRGRALPRLFGHCIDGAQPGITVTTHPGEAGYTYWNVGGQLAEAGANANPAEFESAFRHALVKALPQLPLAATQWSSVLVNRAERENGGRRPDSFCVDRNGPIVSLFPTKLVLAPAAAAAAADAVFAWLGASALSGSDAARPFGAPLEVASPPWLDCQWREWQ